MVAGSAQADELETNTSSSTPTVEDIPDSFWSWLELGGYAVPKFVRSTQHRYAGAAEPESEEPTVRIGGALRFNVAWRSWAGEAQAPGIASFDTFRVDVAARYASFFLSAQYRFYAGYHMLQHGYMGVDLPETPLEWRVGVNQVPFGILPYASHNWFFSLGYYVGLEDDYDLGTELRCDLGAVNLRLAFFKNDEGSYSGGSVDSARYSYDLVRTSAGALEAAGIPEARSLEEVNHTHLRATATASHGDFGTTEFGLSGQIGQTFENETEARNLTWAAAAHVVGNYGWLDVQLELARYEIQLDTRTVSNPGVVAMGAYDAPYAVPASATLIVANVGLEIPVDSPLVDSVTPYVDFSMLTGKPEDQKDTLQLVVGALLTAGPIYIYLDVANGLNHAWLGADYASAFVASTSGAGWHTRANANLGWYF